MPDRDFLRNVSLFVEFDSDELEHLGRSLHRSHFEVNRALIENPKFREAYAMCNR